jgi:predicted secreted protein
MPVLSIAAIYLLFWVLSAFLVMPFGVKTHDELGIEKVPGQAESAPGNFRGRGIILRATVLSAVLCSLYIANLYQGWITTADLDISPLIGLKK